MGNCLTTSQSTIPSRTNGIDVSRKDPTFGERRTSSASLQPRLNDLLRRHGGLRREDCDQCEEPDILPALAFGHRADHQLLRARK